MTLPMHSSYGRSLKSWRDIQERCPSNLLTRIIGEEGVRTGAVEAVAEGVPLQAATEREVPEPRVDGVEGGASTWSGSASMSR